MEEDPQVRPPLRILMVEDNADDRALEERELKKAGIIFDLLCVDNRDEFLKALKEFRADLILCDYNLPQFNALEALKIVHANAPEIPVIIVTGTLTDEMAVECLKKGALDYVIKERLARLPVAIDRAIEFRRNAEDKLANEKQLQTITDVVPAVLSYLTPNLEIKFSNQTYQDWFKKEINGKNAFGVVITQRLREEIPKLSLDSVLNFESELETNDHEKRVMNISLKPDVGNSGELKGYVCLITDISDRKIYEEKLKAAKEEADAANVAKTQFLANMSHEMRTPLSAMLGFTELLTLPEQSERNRIDWINKIGKNVEHLKKMIDEVLDLSKVEAGKLEIHRSYFDVGSVIAQVKSMLYPLAKEKNLDLHFEVEGKIPQKINSDPAKLRHIFINIIGNAIKFSDRTPVIIRARMAGTNQLAFDIEDLGPGIEKAQADRLFQPFVQVDSSLTRKSGGSGLGLALARQYAQALGGDVQLAKTVLGAGSVFTVTVETGDVSKVKEVSYLHPAFEPTPSHTDIDLSGLSVLIVDDAPDNQFLIRRFLEKANALVSVASNGQEAIDTALKDNFDLILMDIQMPVLDGYQATADLRRQGYKKPIIALTAHALKEEKERCLKMGFTDFLTKPIHRLELLNQVAKFKKQAS